MANETKQPTEQSALEFLEHSAISYSTTEEAMEAYASYKLKSIAADSVDMKFVEAVENEIGMGHGAWDMENPVELCRAVLKVASTIERKAQ